MNAWTWSVVVVAALTCAACGPVPPPECTAGPSAICGLERPEDIAPLDDAHLLMVQLRPGDPGRWFSIIEAATLTASPPTVIRQEPVERAGEAGCIATPALRRPRGFDIRPISVAPADTEASGPAWRVVVVSDVAEAGTGGQRIEFLDLIHAPAGWLLSWVGCVDVPDAYFLNDVALGPGGNLFATHMYGRVGGWRARLTRPMFFIGVDTGYAVAWDLAQGWRKVAGSDGAFPNGIAVDPTGSVLYVAYTYNYVASLAKIDLLTGARENAALPLRPDNITWDLDPETQARRLIATGATGLRLVTTSGCEAMLQVGCSFAFSVATVDAITLESRRVLHYERGRVPGASVAARLGNRLFLGTAVGERVTIATFDSKNGDR
ncbi:MAG: hypothetical protein SFV19_06130 [Rhodospirillaceae bacterium]|nr:hypothetical protein [Rhodospirillaceae bacterium]